MNDQELAAISGAPIVGHVDDFHEYDIGDGSPWFNPFSITDFGLEGSIQMYKEYVQKRADLLELIPTLRSHSLACTCRHVGESSPMCHGDALVELYLEWACERLKEDLNYFRGRL